MAWGKVAAAKPDDLHLIPDSRGSSEPTPAIISDLQTCTLASVLSSPQQTNKCQKSQGR